MARNLLDDSSTDDSDNSPTELRVNDEFALKFEHNKKREELQKLEEKHGKHGFKPRKSDIYSGSESSDEESSDMEDEDDAGDLATEALDSEITATIQAIRSKDPRVYDGTTTFYSALQPNEMLARTKQDKPLYLRDYHRNNLLNSAKSENKEAADQEQSYDQAQANLKREVVGAMHAALDSADDEDGDDSLLVVKRRERPEPRIEINTASADKDPETFLSNFMASRAWVPTGQSSYQPFESDDEEEERRAEEYEEAYNFRFEDPAKSNERLRTHARDVAAKQSVRREETNSRKRKREAEKERQAIEKEQRKEEKSRLKKLRVEEVAEKVKRIKRAAGMKASDFKPEDWSCLVEDDWDDATWEKEMQQRFGDEYYAEEEILSGEEKTTRRKPKFDDDIDIQDIVPNFDGEDAAFSLSDDAQPINRPQKRKENRQKEAKKERKLIEQLVDDQLRFDLDQSLPGKVQTRGFRYRETSPQSFGLSSRDILLADDSQLNQFAGLKKLATFRDTEKKRKDKKHLGKKARLRKWREETFGNEEGLENLELMATPLTEAGGGHAVGDDDDLHAQGKKKRRSKRQKPSTSLI